jgi:imidazole glycerol-phosphate synthase subunit HisH
MPAGLTIVVDYGLCNIDSMTRALEECGATHVECTRDPDRIRQCDRIVLPGVGSFAAAMRNLTSGGLVVAIREVVASRRVPFLGACLGMQLMATKGTEGAGDGTIDGLDLVKGEVIRLAPREQKERVPHIGWNEVQAKQGSVLFDGLPGGADFYFVHSYHLRLVDPADEVGRTPYCGGFTAAIEGRGSPTFGTQFHPEKSQKNGFRVLKNFLAV